MAYYENQIEVDLTVRIKGNKPDRYGNYPELKESDELPVLEELKFNSNSPIQAIRKLLDYTRD